jgi:hypothetical protein
MAAIASRTGSTRARRRTCSTPASSSTCARWPAALALAEPLRRHIAERAAATPRFLKQMAVNALEHKPPLAWHGGISGERIDLKLQGTALFVESARLLALAGGRRRHVHA